MFPNNLDNKSAVQFTANVNQKEKRILVINLGGEKKLKRLCWYFFMDRIFKRVGFVFFE